jgi:hypothetical protein
VCAQISGGGASISLLTQQLQTRDYGRKTVRFVRLALEVVTQTEGDFVDVIVLHSLGQYAQKDMLIMND